MPFRSLVRQPGPREHRSGNRFFAGFLKREMAAKLLRNRLRTRFCRLFDGHIAKQRGHDLLRRSHEPIDRIEAAQRGHATIAGTLLFALANGVHFKL